MTDEKSSQSGDRNDGKSDNGGGDQSEQSAKTEIKAFFAGFWRWVEAYFPCPIDEETAEGKKRKRYKEAIKFWMEFFGFFLGIGVAIIFYFQLRSMNTQTANLQGQLDEMKHARELDERAWIVADKLNQSASSEGIVFSVRFTNTGRTPAINVNAKLDAALNLDAIPSKDTNTFTGGRLIPPGGDSGVSNETSPLPITFWEGIAAAKKSFYVYGTIWYDDIFGRHHWSQFCWDVDPNTKTDYTAPIHNSCDEIEENKTNQNLIHP